MRWSNFSIERIERKIASSTKSNQLPAWCGRWNRFVSHRNKIESNQSDPTEHTHISQAHTEKRRKKQNHLHQNAFNKLFRLFLIAMFRRWFSASGSCAAQSRSSFARSNQSDIPATPIDACYTVVAVVDMHQSQWHQNLWIRRWLCGCTFVAPTIPHRTQTQSEKTRFSQTTTANCWSR